MKGALKKAQEYALKQGYTTKVTYLKKWCYSYAFKLEQPIGEDFGEPLVIIVESDGNCYVCLLSDIL